MTGRPCEYTDEKADTICKRLATGESLRSICRSDDMPDRNTVMRWMDARPAFAAKYARAKEIGLDEKADEMREEIINEPDVQRARLLLDYGKWYLSKLAPKKYGDKIEHTGPDGGPLQVNLVRYSGED